MKVKIVKGENTKEVERAINDFISDRRDIKVVDIKEIVCSQVYVFMILYEVI